MVTWISHRGFHRNHTENSLAAFKEAVALGFNSLETDLRYTSDNELVLFHDESLLRIAGVDKKIHTLSKQELLAVPFPNGYRPVFFDEFMQEFAGLSWTFDIKKEGGLKTVELLIKWVNQNGAREWFSKNARYLFWDQTQQQALCAGFPEARCYARKNECIRAGLLTLMHLHGAGRIEEGKTYSLPPSIGPIKLFRKEVVSRFKAVGASVLAYLPESNAEALMAVNAGFDEILTNHSIVAN